MTNRIIVFEGQDRCLKSTIIERIIANDPLHTYHKLHYGKPPKNIGNTEDVKRYQMRNYAQMFNLTKTPKHDFILDRSHIGEMIWAPIYRNYDPFEEISDMEKHWLSECLWQNKTVCLITLVDSNFEQWKNRNDGQGLNSNGDIDKHLKEIAHFQTGFEKTLIKNKKIFDLADYYLPNHRIDDDKLYSQIMELIVSKDMFNEPTLASSK